MTATLTLASGMTLSAAVDADRHALTIRACDEVRGIRLTLESCDHFETQAQRRRAGHLYALEGKKLFFHGRTRMDASANAIELHTCPLDARTLAPVPALMIHYRLEALLGLDAVRVSTWFSTPDPQRVGRLSWLRMKPVDCGFRTFRGFEPSYDGRLADVKHPLRFPALAVQGSQGWAALCACGEAVWIPSWPDYAPDPIERTEAMRNEGTFAPQATTEAEVLISQFTESRPLTATLAFGAGAVSLPTLPAPALPKARDVAGTVYALTSGALTAAVAVRPDGASLLRVNLADWSVDRQPGMGTLTRLLLLRLDTGERRMIDAKRGWARVTAAQTEDCLRVYLEEPAGIADLAVQVEARAAANSRIEWRVHVLNTNPDYSVLHAGYPGLSFYGGNPTAFVPQDSGALLENPYAAGIHHVGIYPNGFTATMALFGLYDAQRAERNGLYVAVHDAGGARKDMTLQCVPSGEGAIDIVYGAPNLYRPANAFALAGTLVWQVFDGDWYDLTGIYRDFVHARADWMPAHGRKDSPAWMREVPLYIMDWMPNDNPDADPIPISIRPEILPPRDDWYKTPIRLADALGVPIGYHLYNWHWIPFNNDFPHYFPVKEGLVEGVDAMHEHNIHVMPYINGRLWDTKDCRGEDAHFSEEALAHTTKSCDGQPDLETYASHEPDGSLAQLAAMCPTSWRWRKQLLDIVKRLFAECHMDAVYIDQVAAAVMNLCADETHSHTPGNGDWWVTAYRLLMDRLRNETPADRGFTTESNAETYADQFDGFLTWTWITSNLVPAFPLIYGGRIAMFGRNTNGYKKSDLPYYRYHVAQAVLFGQQIGWINPDLVDVPEKLAFMKRLARLRYELREVFSQGRMLRPPRFRGDVPQIVTDTGMGISRMFVGDTLLAGAWSLEGRTLLLLANVEEAVAQAEVWIPWQEYGADPAAVRKIDGPGEILDVLPEGLRVSLPGCDVLVLESKEG